MIKEKFSFFSIVLLLFFVACGGSSSHSNETAFDFSGAWEDISTFLESTEQKSCYEEDLAGQIYFDIQHINKISENTYELSNSAAAPFATATVNKEGSLVFTVTISRDFFGDGTLCEMVFKYSFLPRSDGRLDTLRSDSILCDDMYSCENDAYGIAERR